MRFFPSRTKHPNSGLFFHYRATLSLEKDDMKAAKEGLAEIMENISSAEPGKSFLHVLMSKTVSVYLTSHFNDWPPVKSLTTVTSGKRDTRYNRTEYKQNILINP